MVTNRESSSKDSSNGEDDLVAGEASEMTAKDRRVTFRNAAVADRRLDGNNGRGLHYPLRKCASVSFQHTSIEKRLRMLAHEN